MILRGPHGESPPRAGRRGARPLRDRGGLAQAGHAGRAPGWAGDGRRLGPGEAPLLLGPRLSRAPPAAHASRLGRGGLALGGHTVADRALFCGPAKSGLPSPQSASGRPRAAGALGEGRLLSLHLDHGSGGTLRAPWLEPHDPAGRPL